MKKYFILLTLLLIISFGFLIISKWSYVNNFWNWDAGKKLPSEVQIDINNWKLRITSFVYSTMKTISYIDYQIIDNQILISNYAKLKYINFFPRNSIFINLNKKWLYNIYYKNWNWTLDFIKEIEYK